MEWDALLGSGVGILSCTAASLRIESRLCPWMMGCCLLIRSRKACKTGRHCFWKYTEREKGKMLKIIPSKKFRGESVKALWYFSPVFVAMEVWYVEHESHLRGVWHSTLSYPMSINVLIRQLTFSLSLSILPWGICTWFEKKGWLHTYYPSLSAAYAYYNFPTFLPFSSTTANTTT